MDQRIKKFLKKLFWGIILTGNLTLLYNSVPFPTKKEQDRAIIHDIDFHHQHEYGKALVYEDLRDYAKAEKIYEEILTKIEKDQNKSPYNGFGHGMGYTYNVIYQQEQIVHEFAWLQKTKDLEGRVAKISMMVPWVKGTYYEDHLKKFIQETKKYCSKDPLP